MKTFLVALMILSTQAQAAFQCDISTDSVATSIVSTEKIVKTASHTSSFNAQGISQTQAIQQCTQTGADDCQLSGETACKYNNRGARYTGGFFSDSWTCKSIAVGVKRTFGQKLSSEEIVENKRLHICKKLDSCRNQVLNDSNTVTSDFDKIDYLANKYRCE